MTVQFQNFDYRYNKKGKPIFVPNDLGRRIGYDIKAQVENAIVFDEHFYHLRKGGHVAALQAHRQHQYFAKIDITNFFYSVSRRRVQTALTANSIYRARHYAKFSCVRNPYGTPDYSLPYGFVQSPILATLVLQHSDAGQFLRDLEDNIEVSVYMDDVSISSDDFAALQQVYKQLLDVLPESDFEVNLAKAVAPHPQMVIFNCDLEQGRTSVTDQRIAEFLASFPSQESENAFIAYCASVELGNY